jgi:hypothetical protein
MAEEDDFNYVRHIPKQKEYIQLWYSRETHEGL